jgi:hypothetical protein
MRLNTFRNRLVCASNAAGVAVLLKVCCCRLEELVNPRLEEGSVLRQIRHRRHRGGEQPTSYERNDGDMGLNELKEAVHKKNSPPRLNNEQAVCHPWYLGIFAITSAG